jgi:ribosome-binding factor A
MGYHPFKRSARVAEVIKEEIGNLILHTLKDPRIGFISVTRVEVSSDLRHAKVFVSVYGDSKSTKRSMAGLESAKGFIRQRIGERIRMKYLPEIVFKLDQSISESIRIEKIIDSVCKRNEKTTTGDSQDS